MADTLTFYTNPQSRGQVIRWLLEELGQPYETVLLDYGTTMKAPDYLAINPMGKVPAIRRLARMKTEIAPADGSCSSLEVQVPSGAWAIRSAASSGLRVGTLS